MKNIETFCLAGVLLGVSILVYAAIRAPASSEVKWVGKPVVFFENKPGPPKYLPDIEFGLHPDGKVVWRKVTNN